MVVEVLLMEGKVEEVVERHCIARKYSMKRMLRMIQGYAN
jgi:hypothetical protein